VLGRGGGFKGGDKHVGGNWRTGAGGSVQAESNKRKGGSKERVRPGE